MKLFLIGLPGSGKSFLGKRLAEEANVPFIDLDKVIEEEACDSIDTIFSTKGEEYFRALEAVALRQQSKTSDFVMACGGGTPCFHDNMKFITETGKSIFLDLSIPEIVKRLASEQNQLRPLLTGSQDTLEHTVKNLRERRISFYNQASFIVTEASTPAKLLQLIRN